MERHKLNSKIKSLIKKIDKNYLILLSVTLILFFASTVVSFLFLIYTKDEPSYVPAEIKGAVRDGIKNNIAKPLASVIPAVGNPFLNAAFTYKNNDSFTNSKNFSDPDHNNSNDSGDFNTWKTYKNEDLGFEIKVPEDYEVIKDGPSSVMFVPQESTSPFYSSKKENEGTGVPYWGGRAVFVTSVAVQGGETAEQYIKKQFGTEGVQTSSVRLGQFLFNRVIDSGPNRYGGGVGYYYITEKNSYIYEIGVDYFLNQSVEDPLNETLDLIVKSFR